MTRFIDQLIIRSPKVNTRSYRAIYLSFLRTCQLLDHNYLTKRCKSQFLEDSIHLVHSTMLMPIRETQLVAGPLSNLAQQRKASHLISHSDHKVRISSKKMSSWSLRSTLPIRTHLQPRLNSRVPTCLITDLKKKFSPYQCSHSRLLKSFKMQVNKHTHVMDNKSKLSLRLLLS